MSTNPNQKINVSEALKTLTEEELSRLFHIVTENVALFEKLMPGKPFFKLVAADPAKAYALLHHARTK